MPSKIYRIINDQFENINDNRINGCISKDVKNFNHHELGEINNFFRFVYNDMNKATFFIFMTQRKYEAIINNFSSVDLTILKQ
jgi:hypothetical protein